MSFATLFAVSILIVIFHNGKFCFWVPFFKKLLLRNYVTDFVKICNVCVRKAIIEAAKRIINSDKACHSYSDLNFGVTFFGTQCTCRHKLPYINFYCLAFSVFSVFTLKLDTLTTQAYVRNCFDSDLTTCLHYCLYLTECLVVIKTMLLLTVTLKEETWLT